MKISIVLPIYNVEKYLPDCINSIIDQKSSDECEIILVNDGSTDNSPSLCDAYASEYSNIKVFHKKNGGLSDTRNYGLKYATGEYILFVDSDDCLCQNALSEFNKELELSNPDIIIGDAVVIDEDGNKVEKSDFQYIHKGLKRGVNYSGFQVIREQLSYGVMQTTVWLGLYRREFLLENRLFFQNGLLHEDELWTPTVFIKANEVKYIPSVFYAYRIRQNSIMRKQNQDCSENIKSLIYIYSHLDVFYKKNVKDMSTLKLLLADMSKRYLYAITLWDFPKYPELMKQVDRKEIFNNASGYIDKIRSIILLVDPKFYYILSKKLRNL